MTTNLDNLTNQITAFRTFQEMTQRGLIDNYSPSLSPRFARRTDRRIRKANEDKAILADAFDHEMAKWGSPVRAFRG